VREIVKERSKHTTEYHHTNMPIYFGIDPPRTQRGNTTRVSEALERKGIKLIRASPSDLSILCFPTIFSPALALIYSFFSVILTSLAKSQTVGITDDDLEVAESHPDPFPIKLPPLAVALRSSNEHGHDVLSANGFELVSIQGKDVYLNGTITKEQLRTITETSSLDLNRICYAPVGFCNLSSMSTALDLIALFSFAAQALGVGIHGGESGSEEADDYDYILGDDISMEPEGILRVCVCYCLADCRFEESRLKRSFSTREHIFNIFSSSLRVAGFRRRPSEESVTSPPMRFLTLSLVISSGI
jgi:hypothetical protein